jgi:hypothetical protein
MLLFDFFYYFSEKYLQLRKHLLENVDAFKSYIDLKLNLANKALDVNDYCRLKTDLILEFLEAEGVTEKELDEIQSENLF